MSALDLPEPPPGTVAREWLEPFELPTGAVERLPCIVIEGADSGPTCWLTAGVHGDESTGIAAAHDAVAAIEPTELTGRVVCIPVVAPAGVRRRQRRSYYHGKDPNRTFPDPTDRRPPDTETTEERLSRRLYERIDSEADCVLDLHTAEVNSRPFVVRHRVLYGECRDCAAATALSEELDRLVSATGLPVVRQYPPERYVASGRHRTLSGAVLNGAGVPACTLELGGPNVVDERCREVGVAAIHRVLEAFGLLNTVSRDIEAAAPTVESPVEYPVRWSHDVRTDISGLVRHRLEAGDTAEAGDVIADIVDATGDRKGAVITPYDGYVLGRWSPPVYENDPVASMAVRDEEPVVAERP